MKTAFDIAPLKCVSAIVCEKIVYYSIIFGEFQKTTSIALQSKVARN